VKRKRGKEDDVEDEKIPPAIPEDDVYRQYHGLERIRRKPEK